MTKLIRPLFPLALVLALGACQKQDGAVPAKTDTAAAPTADSIGVAECDDYLKRYEACVASKVPDSVKGTLKQSLDQTRAAWKSAAATDAGKQGLAMACKQAYDASKASMQQYGCSDF